MKRRADWTDWTYFAVLAALATAALGWPTLLMFAGLGILLYVQQRRLNVDSDETLLEAFDEFGWSDNAGARAFSLNIVQRQALLETIRRNGFDLIRVQRAWPRPFSIEPDDEPLPEFYENIVRVDRAALLAGKGKIGADPSA